MQKLTPEKHEGVLTGVFGTGDINICTAKQEGKKYANKMYFYNQSPRPIGESTNELVGTSTDELERPALVLIFNKPESITSLIHQLIELQKEVFEFVKET